MRYVRDWKFLYSGGWGDRLGVWGQISGMLILWGGGWRQRLGMFIFSEGWFRVGVWGQTYHIRNVNIGGGPCGVTGGMGGSGKAMGDAYIIKGWGVLRQTLDMLIL